MINHHALFAVISIVLLGGCGAGVGSNDTGETQDQLTPEGYGSIGNPDNVPSGTWMQTTIDQYASTRVAICRIKAWENPNGGYEAGRLAYEHDPNWGDGNVYLCHYGWNGQDAWNGGDSLQVLEARNYQWVTWDGNNDVGAVGSSEGTPHCEALQSFGGETKWWAGKISYGACHVAASGGEHNYGPSGTTNNTPVRVLR